MSKQLVKRNFARQYGMVYTGDVLDEVPEPFLTDWTELGLIEPYDENGVTKLPEFISTGKPMQRVDQTPEPKQMEGKPDKKTKRK